MLKLFLLIVILFAWTKITIELSGIPMILAIVVWIALLAELIRQAGKEWNE